MRLHNLKAFHKHLSDSAPHHLCRAYYIAIGDDFERSQAIESVLALLPGTPSRFRGSECSIVDLLDAMQSLSLFGGEPIVVLDEVEKLTKAPLQQLCEGLNFSSGYIVFGARSKSSLAQIIEKEGVVLDMLDEKPWEKEKRLAGLLVERAKRAGKSLTPDGAGLLLEHLGIDAALLDSEVDKLICYVGDGTHIGREEIMKLTPISRTASLWQMAEEVVWEGHEFTGVDSSSFPVLVAALRNQLHIGLVLATLIAEQRPSDQWSAYLPKLWPKMLEKRSSQAARLGSDYFRKGLDRLFDVELLSRTGSTQLRALLDSFRALLGRVDGR